MKHQESANREIILNTAESEFAAHGLAGARIDRIAASAGVNKALIYYYFPNKQGLYDRVIDQLFMELETALFPALDRVRNLPEAIDAVLDAYFSVFFDHPCRARIFARELAAGGGSILRRARGEEGRYFQRLLDNLQRIGEFSDEGVLHFLLSMMGLILFPFMARDVFAGVFTPRAKEELFAARREETKRVLLQAYGWSEREARS